jgi:hypothetical protein
LLLSGGVGAVYLFVIISNRFLLWGKNVRITFCTVK